MASSAAFCSAFPALRAFALVSFFAAAFPASCLAGSAAAKLKATRQDRRAPASLIAHLVIYTPSLTDHDHGATVLSAEELERYARHIVLREVGGPGQAKLKNARVLVIGAGGLGAPVLMYLAAAGVGTLGVIDDDVVSLSNLQRQIIHGTSDIGKSKVASAAAMICRLNPHVAVETHAARLTSANRSEERRVGKEWRSR